MASTTTEKNSSFRVETSSTIGSESRFAYPYYDNAFQIEGGLKENRLLVSPYAPAYYVRTPPRRILADLRFLLFFLLLYDTSLDDSSSSRYSAPYHTIHHT